jgi:hypothetical protein
LGFPNWSCETSRLFSGAVAREKEISARGVSHFQSFYFVIVLLSFFTLFCLLLVYQKYKKNSSFYSWYFFTLFLVHFLIPEYVLEDLSVGSGSIIGKDNIEELFNHISRHKDIEDRSLLELAPNYKTAAAYLVHMLEARFVNLNPIIQQMFLKLHYVEDPEKRDFILETLRKEFRDVVIEARKVFDCFNMLGSCVAVIGTLDKTKPKKGEEIKIPIPFKLLGMHEALEKNFDWIVPENSFDDSSEPKSVEKGSSKTYMDKIQFLVENTSGTDLDASSLENT